MNVDSYENHVQGNFIGIDQSGTVAMGNVDYGVDIAASSWNVIGGAGSRSRNVICSNDLFGVSVSGLAWGTYHATVGNRIADNFIGVSETGTSALGNHLGGVGITDASDTVVEGNIISGNSNDGVSIAAEFTGIHANYIGIDVNGDPMGNNGHGVSVMAGNTMGAIGNTISENLIAHNAHIGVLIDSGVSNRITQNSIYDNGDLGIDLVTTSIGVTPNDANDVDTGANELQNYPDLASVTGAGMGMAIVGDLHSLASTTFVLEFFENPSNDISGHGEGEMFLGDITVTTDSSGNAAFTFTTSAIIPTGHYVSATATDPGGNTSEFSAALHVH